MKRGCNALVAVDVVLDLDVKVGQYNKILSDGYSMTGSEKRREKSEQMSILNGSK